MRDDDSTALDIVLACRRLRRFVEGSISSHCSAVGRISQRSALIPSSRRSAPPWDGLSASSFPPSDAYLSSLRSHQQRRPSV